MTPESQEGIDHTGEGRTQTRGSSCPIATGRSTAWSFSAGLGGGERQGDTPRGKDLPGPNQLAVLNRLIRLSFPENDEKESGSIWFGQRRRRNTCSPCPPESGELSTPRPLGRKRVSQEWRAPLRAPGSQQFLAGSWKPLNRGLAGAPVTVRRSSGDSGEPSMTQRLQRQRP